MAINRYGGLSRNYGPSVKVAYLGPFFQRDPAKTARENAHDFIERVMSDAYGVAVVAAPERSGDYLYALRNDALRFRAVSGRKWQVTGVLSMRQLSHPWKGSRVPRRGRGGGGFNYAGKVERKYHVFRKAKSTVYSSRKHNKDLLKGLT